MQKLQCEICGGTEFQRTDNGMIQCKYCGCQYTMEQARNIISGTVEIVHGEAELVQTIKNADALGKMGNYSEMLSAYKDIEKNYAHEKLYWESLFKSICNVLLHVETIKYKGTIVGADTVIKKLLYSYKNTLSLCKNEESFEIEQYFRRFCENWISNCLNGEFDIIDSYTYYGLMNGDFLNFCKTFPGAGVLLEQSEKNIQSMIQYGIEPDEKGGWKLHDFSNYKRLPLFDNEGRHYTRGVGPHFMIGKTYVYGYECDGIVTRNVKLQNSFCAENAKTIRDTLVTEWNTMVNCPKCGQSLTGLIKRRTCKRCRRTFELIKL